MIQTKNTYVSSFTLPASPKPATPSLFVMVVSIGDQLLARTIQSGKAVEIPCEANEAEETIYSRMLAKIKGVPAASEAALA